MRTLQNTIVSLILSGIGCFRETNESQENKVVDEQFFEQLESYRNVFYERRLPDAISVAIHALQETRLTSYSSGYVDGELSTTVQREINGVQQNYLVTVFAMYREVRDPPQQNEAISWYSDLEVQVTDPDGMRFTFDLDMLGAPLDSFIVDFSAGEYGNIQRRYVRTGLQEGVARTADVFNVGDTTHSPEQCQGNYIEFSEYKTYACILESPLTKAEESLLGLDAEVERFAGRERDLLVLAKNKN